MEIFAGLIGFGPSSFRAQNVVDSLLRELSRHPGDRPQLVRGERCALVHLDCSTGSSDGILQDADGSLACLAGQPLLPTDGGQEGSLGHLRRLHHDWRADRARELAGSRGVFSCVHIDPLHGRARLATDKLGIRPLFCAWLNDTLVFATSLRMVLVLFPQLAERPDFVCRAQLSSIKYALGERTPYEGVKQLRPGTMLDVVNGVPQQSTYWDWRDIAPSALDQTVFCNELKNRFSQAVQVRLGAQNSVLAQLSGGLDSRCVVAALRAQGKQTHTVNFAPPGSADLVLGRLIAQALDTHHFEATDATFSNCPPVTAHRQWRSRMEPDQLPERADWIWSGHGGESVLALTESSTDLLGAVQDGDVEQVARLFCSNNEAVLQRRMFRSGRFEPLNEKLLTSVCDELQRYTRDDLGRGLRTFIVMHYTRGQNLRHYEDIDLHRIDYVTPFCDAEIVALALSAPLEWVLRHRLYYQWLSTFQPAVREVAWQAYPVSDPCPVPLPAGLRNQWTHGWHTPAQQRRRQRQSLHEHGALFQSADFPHDLLHRGRLQMVYWLARIGVLRYLYLLEAARPFVQRI